MKNKLDLIDRKLINFVSEGVRVSTSIFAKRLGITNPTVRSRLGILINSKILKIAGVVNVFKIKGIVIALVGITLERYQLDKKIEEIANLNQVIWAAVVTGRYDIIIEIISTDGMHGIYKFLTQDLQKIGGIKSSESFLIMKAKNKWISLSKKIKFSQERLELTVE